MMAAAAYIVFTGTGYDGRCHWRNRMPESVALSVTEILSAWNILYLM